MFAGRVPGPDDEDETRRDAALKWKRQYFHLPMGNATYFEYPLKGPQRDELLKILGESNAEDHNAPTEHIT